MEIHNVRERTQKGGTITHNNINVFLFGWETNGIKNFGKFEDMNAQFEKA